MIRNGKFLIKNNSLFISSYTLIYEYADKLLGEYLLKYHNKKIEQAIIECYEKIKNISGINFIDSFLLCTERLNLVVCKMSELFGCMSNNILKSVDEKKNRKCVEDDVSHFSMNIYKKYFFDKLQIKLFIILNEILLREERNGNMEYSLKIQSIMKIINYMDFIKPIIIKINENSSTWSETSQETNPLTNQRKWFEYFKEVTIKYNINKAEKDRKNYDGIEYIRHELKYLKEEYKRETDYFNTIFHNEINFINYKYLIKYEINKIINTNKKEEINEIFQLSNCYLNIFDFYNHIFDDFIKARISTLRNDNNISKDERKYMQSLIGIKNEIDEYVELYFNNKNEFKKKIDDEFCFLLIGISPEYLKDYEDFCMKIGFKYLK